MQCPNCGCEIEIEWLEETASEYRGLGNCRRCGNGGEVIMPKTPQTSVVNLRKEPYDVYIGRGSKWGNPFKMADYSEAERNRVCDEYEKWFWSTDLINEIHELHGKVLGCYCKPQRCHGDFLAKVANGEITCLKNDQH